MPTKSIDKKEQLQERALDVMTNLADKAEKLLTPPAMPPYTVPEPPKVDANVEWVYDKAQDILHILNGLDVNAAVGF